MIGIVLLILQLCSSAHESVPENSSRRGRPLLSVERIGVISAALYFITQFPVVVHEILEFAVFFNHYQSSAGVLLRISVLRFSYIISLCNYSARFLLCCIFSPQFRLCAGKIFCYSWVSATANGEPHGIPVT